jgi:uncharacterized protein YegP (UPF0339 family)
MARSRKANTVARSNPEFYRDTAGDWRWRVYATNGRIVGDSAEGYRRVADAEKGFNALRAAMAVLPPVAVEKPTTLKPAPAAESPE